MPRHPLPAPGFAPARQSFRRRTTVACLVAAMSALAAQAQSANGTYTSQTGAWNVAGSWQDGIIATGADSTAFLTNDVTTSERTTSLGANRVIGNIVFTDADNTTGFNRVIGSNALTLDVTTGSPTIDVTQSNRTLRITSTLNGNDGLIKTGPGTLTLNSGSGNPSTNTLSGPIQILQGIIQYGNANQGGPTTGAHTVAISSGASLRFRHGGTDVITYNADISGAGSVHMIYNNGAGGGSLTLGGNNTFTGGLNLSPSSGTNVITLKAGAATALGSGNVTFNQYGRLDLNGQSPVTGLLIGVAGSIVANDATVPATLTLQSDDATTRTFAGIIQNGAGSVSIVKAGTGTQVFSGANSYTGTTTVNGGTLRITNNNTLSDTQAVRLATGAVLDLPFSGTDTVGALALGGVLQPAGVYGRVGSGAQFETALITGDGLLNNLNSNDAVIHYWDGTGASWGSAASWTINPADPASDPAASPGSGSAPIFGADGVAASTVGLGGDQTVFGLSFVSPVVFTFTGGGVSSDLNLGASGLNLDADAGGAVFGSPEANQDADVVLATSQTWVNGNATADVSTLNTLALGSHTLTFAGPGSFTVNGPVSGAGTLVFSGAGNRTVSSPVSTLGAIVSNGTGATVFTNTFAITSAIGKRGTGTLEFSGAAVSTGDITTDNGAVTFSGTGGVATGNILVRGAGDSGTTFGTAVSSVTFGAGTVTSLAADKSIQVGNNSTGGTFALQTLNAAGTFTHAGSLYLGRAARMNVSGNWTQTGPATIATQGGAFANLTVSGGGQFTYANATNFLFSTSTSLNTIGRITLDGGTMTTGVNFHNSQATVAAGTSVDVIFANGGTLRLSADIPDLFTTAGATRRLQFDVGGGTVDTNGFSTTMNGPAVGTGGITKAGAGTLTLTDINTYAGDTTVTGGTLVLVQDNTANDLSTVSVASGAFLSVGAGVVDTVARLILDGVQQAAGDYTSANSGGRILGEGTIRVVPPPVTDPYVAWISGFPLGLNEVDTTSDPDGDGINNLLEYVLNGNPAVADAAILPRLTVTATDFEFTYQRRKDSVADIVQTFQWGTTLASWPGAAIIPAASATVAPATVTVSAGVPDDTVTDTVKVSIPLSENGGTGRLFGRLQTVKP